MARNKESLLLLLDVGTTMHSVLEEVEKVCSMLLEKKLIFSKNDEVGIIIFGTEETNNELTTEVGGYEHVVVMRTIKVVDGDLVEAVQKLPRGAVCGDFLDAIVVGMDMLIKKYGPTNKGKKRLCLITDGACPIKDPYEGTKEDQVGTIASQMSAHGMKMDSVVVRMQQYSDVNKRVMEENDHLFDIFSKKTKAKAIYVESPTSLLGAIRTRNIAPVTIYRGHLEISSNLKIKVWVYKKTAEEKFPTLKKYSDKAPSTDKFATHEIKVDYEYKSVTEPSRVVPPEQRIKGYRYGPQVVPISSAEWDAVKFKPEKSVKLLGFTAASNIMRHYYMKDVSIFIPEPGNANAIQAVSALARAMKELNKVGILRCVWRQGQGNVVVGVLTPNISNKDSVPDSFYFNVLPFAEDVREFQFPSFSKFPPLWQPTDQQQEAADKFVEMLDLAPQGKQETLQPDFTPNPVLERYYRCLKLKSEQPDALVPPLDGTLKRITEPDPDVLSLCSPSIDEFHRCFELKENPKLKKSTKRIRTEPSGSSDERHGFRNGMDDNAVKLLGNSSAVKVEKIGDLETVQDFEAMLSRRDSPEWVSKAITDMKRKIIELIENSEGDSYNKALDCLVSLRRGCILEQEPKHFNDLLRHVIKLSQEKNLSRFCDLLASKGVTLISKTEAVDSEVTEEEASNFMVKKSRNTSKDNEM